MPESQAPTAGTGAHSQAPDPEPGSDRTREGLVPSLALWVQSEYYGACQSLMLLCDALERSWDQWVVDERMSLIQVDAAGLTITLAATKSIMSILQAEVG